MGVTGPCTNCVTARSCSVGNCSPVSWLITASIGMKPVSLAKRLAGPNWPAARSQRGPFEVVGAVERSPVVDQCGAPLLG